MHIFLLKTAANSVLILQLLALILVIFSSKGSQKLSVCMCVYVLTRVAQIITTTRRKL